VQIQTVPLKVEASKVSDFYNKFFSPHWDPEIHNFDTEKEAHIRRTRFCHSWT
jgi:hypothetical protein